MSDHKMTKVVFDCKVSERKILIVPIATISRTPYNPAARTKEGAKLKNLIDGIKEYGQLYPVLITAERELVDGNRRLTACTALGYTHLECIILDMDRDKAFTAINTTPEKLGGKGWLEVGRGGGYLYKKEREQYDELAGLVGEFGIDLLIQKNLGLNILPLCKSVANLGLSRGLGEIILLTAKNGLTNKINFELRAEKTKPEKMQSLEKLLRDAAKEIV
ncbi:ParB/RepB/Spo0J family partition protein [Paraburkholderia sp. BL17N1]|uniref:ParB/RepB/Spo0J family partition protein n=1 Tax=Paraburkholderia sp. BL17N1 TaxID=1938798 RepID=UPI000EAD8D89|nr:ParB/RepB/Spo0J family partition protein [Paraburkholderia sp. BL17N1]RKR36190.1 ParB-like nuclease family protein [Paraburkholderia sp. BL17N1]